MGDQACERFEKKWQMSGIEFHWSTHKRQCELEDEQLEAESKSLPDKLQAVTAELQELTRKVGAARGGAGGKGGKGGWRVLAPGCGQQSWRGVCPRSSAKAACCAACSS